MNVRVVVAEDQQIVRECFAALLATQPDVKVVGTAADGEEAVRICRNDAPPARSTDSDAPFERVRNGRRRLRAASRPPGSCYTAYPRRLGIRFSASPLRF